MCLGEVLWSFVTVALWLDTKIMEMERGHLLGEPHVRGGRQGPAALPSQAGMLCLLQPLLPDPSTACGRERRIPSESCSYQSQGDENPLEMPRCVRAQVIFQALVVGCGEGMAEPCSSDSHPAVPVVPVIPMGSRAEAEADAELKPREEGITPAALMP